MAAHTSGPWAFEQFGSSPEQGVIVASDGAVLVKIRHRGTAVDMAANARLIAAAPEMLAALKSFNVGPDQIVGAQAQDLIIRLPMSAITAAAAAVAKAEGRS